MLAHLPYLTLVRLWTALLVGVIGLQATVPDAPSLQKTHGSAFSASTYEVALLVERGERVQRHATAPQPLVPVALLAAAPLAAAAALYPLHAPRPDSTGPPPHDVQSWQPAPRAPPRA